MVLPEKSVSAISTDLNIVHSNAKKILKKKPKTLLEFSNLENLTHKNFLVDKSVSKTDIDPLIVSKDRTIKEPRKTKSLLNKYLFNKLFICCKESRIENPNSFYGCFYVGPFEESLSQTLAHNIRRTLLSELTGVAITAVEIDGVLHKFSSIPGIQETALDIICNLQNLVFKKVNLSSSVKNNSKAYFSDDLFPALGGQTRGTKTTDRLGSSSMLPQIINEIAYLRERGPGVVKAKDIILPFGIQVVNPEQYIATLAEDGILNMKLYINEGKNYIKQKQKNVDLAEIQQRNQIAKYSPSNALETKRSSRATLLVGNQKESEKQRGIQKGEAPPSLEEPSDKATLVTNGSKNSNKIFLDSVFMPVTKVNATIQNNDKYTDDLLENNKEFTNIPYPNVKNGEVSVFPLVFKRSGSNQRPIEKIEMQSLLLQKSKASAPPGRANFNTDLYSSHFDISSDSTNLERNSTIGQSRRKEFKSSVLKNQPKTSPPTCFFLEKPSNINSSESKLFTTDNYNSFLTNNYLTKQDNTRLNTDPFIQLSQSMHTGNTNRIPQTRQSHIILEIWTNGSLHPREALSNSLHFLSTTFVTLENIKMLGSMYQSDITYGKILNKKVQEQK
jgi:DNA-directed RNA polymerase alpha subunit